MIYHALQKLKLTNQNTMDKYYKIVYGFNEGDYFPITSNELHKALIMAIDGGGATFEAGYFNNRGKDIMRIEPDWHRVRGWNRGYKMEVLDFEDIRPLEESYKKTLSNAKLLVDYILKENRQDLLLKSAPEAFKEIPKGKYKNQIENHTKQLTDKFKI